MKNLEFLKKINPVYLVIGTGVISVIFITFFAIILFGGNSNKVNTDNSLQAVNSTSIVPTPTFIPTDTNTPVSLPSTAVPTLMPTFTPTYVPTPTTRIIRPTTFPTTSYEEWKTYYNNDFDLSIKYPATYKVEEYDSGLVTECNTDIVKPIICTNDMKLKENVREFAVYDTTASSKDRNEVIFRVPTFTSAQKKAFGEVSKCPIPDVFFPVSIKGKDNLIPVCQNGFDGTLLTWQEPYTEIDISDSNSKYKLINILSSVYDEKEYNNVYNIIRSIK